MQRLMASSRPIRLSSCRRSKAPASDVREPPLKSAWIFLRFRLANNNGCVIQPVIRMAFLFGYWNNYNSLYYKRLGHLPIKKSPNPVKYSG